MGCLLWLFTALLGFLLVLQIPFVLLFVFDREVKIPSGIVRTVSENLFDETFEVSFSGVTLDQHGTFRLTDPEIRNSAGRRLLSAERMSVDLFLPSTLLGFPQVDRIEVANVALWDPTGPLGNTESLSKIHSVCVERDGMAWELVDFRAELDKLQVIAAGTIRPEDWKQIRLPEPREEAFALEESIRRLALFRSQLTRIHDPFVQIFFPEDTDQGERVRVSASADRLELAGGVSLTDELRLQGSLQRSGDQILPGLFVFSAKTLRREEDLVVQRPVLSLKLPSHITDHGRYDGSEIFASAQRLSSPEGELENPVLRLAVAPDLSLTASGSLSLFGHPFSLGAEIPRNLRTATLELRGIVSVDDLLEHPAVPAEARKPSLDFGEGLFLKAETELRFAKPIPESIRFAARSTSPMNLEGFRALYAEADGVFRVRDEAFEVKRLSVECPDFHLNGKYFHDFSNNHFRLFVDGGFFPSAIDGWMRPWWSEMWDAFEIPKEASVNLELSGDWDHRDTRQLFGGIAFEDITLKGTKIRRGHAQMWSRPYFFELFDLVAYRPEGKISGSLGNLLNWENREMFARLYDFESTFALEAVAPLFGDAVQDIVNQFETDHAPTISIQGTLLPEPRNDGDPREELVIRAESIRPLLYRGIRIDTLSLQANYANDSVRVEPLRFDLGGGTGNAAVHWDLGNPERGSLQLEFTGGDPAAVVDAIPVLAEATGDRFTEEREDRTDPSRNVDFSIACTGDPENPETLVGAGSLDLRTPNLANVRLLGILSRISEELPLPLTLGSFAFERAYADFILNRGLVEFSRFDLYSSTSRVAASGSYEMEKESVDFDAKMQLMGAVKFPILAQIGMLLNPVGEVFEFRVFGPVDDMKWRLYLDPRSW